MSYPYLESNLQLAIFRLEDVCVRVQDGMEGFLRTAALEKTAQIEATFRWLRKRGVRVALISDAARPDAEILLERLNWRVGEEEPVQFVLTGQAAKHNPIRRVLDLAGLPNGRAVLSVFDTPRLLWLAHGAGLRFNLGVTNGRTSYAELATVPRYALLDEPVQLPNFLLEHLPTADRPHAPRRRFGREDFGPGLPGAARGFTF